MNADDAKRSAALEALKEVADGMIVGLGTGSTSAIFVDVLIERVRRESLSRIIAIPTSEHTADQARRGGITLGDFSTCTSIDVTFDGADVVELEKFSMLKGLGGALLREKIVAQASKRLVIMIDPSKVPARFGGVVPVEIVRFGHEVTMARLKEIAPIELRRTGQSSEVFVTDSGNCIVDLTLPDIGDPTGLQSRIKGIAGVVETGLFIDMADKIIIGHESGVEVHEKNAQPHRPTR